MRKLIFLYLALFWTGFVAYCCLTSSTNIPTPTIPNFDKLAHFVFYFGFVLVWYLFWQKQFNTKNVFQPLLISFTISVFFGVIIEILQEIYTLTRKSDVRDVLANIIGSTFAMIVVVFRNKYLNKILV